MQNGWVNSIEFLVGKLGTLHVLYNQESANHNRTTSTTWTVKQFLRFMLVVATLDWTWILLALQFLKLKVKAASKDVFWEHGGSQMVTYLWHHNPCTTTYLVGSCQVARTANFPLQIRYEDFQTVFTWIHQNLSHHPVMTATCFS